AQATRRSAASSRTSAETTARRAGRTAETRAKAEVNALQGVAAQAERAVLIPVGAALEVRETVIEAAKPFTSREAAERELSKYQRRIAQSLRRYERRGTTARNRLEREVKRTRTRVERELRQRRNEASRLVRRESRVVGTEVKGASRDLRNRAGSVQSTTETVVKRFQTEVLS
ncbi:MAG: hypothetical protein H0T96_04655, partial [Thermoleophilaceae bacterium]|nr:hypothetical protein [Thermoleophilaceae bacterium]